MSTLPILRCSICRRRKVAKKDDWCKRCVVAIRHHVSLEFHRLENDGGEAEYLSSGSIVGHWPATN